MNVPAAHAIGDVEQPNPPVEWRHNGSGNLQLAGGICWRQPLTFRLEFAEGRLEMLEARRRRWLELYPGDELGLAAFVEGVMATLELAIERAESYRRRHPEERPWPHRKKTAA